MALRILLIVLVGISCKSFDRSNHQLKENNPASAQAISCTDGEVPGGGFQAAELMNIETINKLNDENTRFSYINFNYNSVIDLENKSPKDGTVALFYKHFQTGTWWYLNDQNWCYHPQNKTIRLGSYLFLPSEAEIEPIALWTKCIGTEANCWFAIRYQVE